VKYHYSADELAHRNFGFSCTKFTYGTGTS
jgi:hypothetical protein